MLYEVSENLTEDDVKSAMFLLRLHLPKKQSTMTALELLTALEKQDLLAENNLGLLKETCYKISPELLCRVNRYEQNKEIGQANQEFASSSFTEQPFGNSVTTVQKSSSINAPNTKDSYTEEFGSLKQHVARFGSLPARQDVKAGNTAVSRNFISEQSAGNEESKTTAEKPAQYKMDGPHRGYCLIVNNTNFVNLLERRGSHTDVRELKRVFTWLGLEVEIYDNQTSTEMRKILQKWQSDQKWKDNDCLVFFILSHGESGQVYGTDEELIPIRTIMSYFTAKRCPLLAQKPKLFFIQACQGKKVQQAFILEADSGDSMGIQADAQTSGYISPQQMASSIPDEADFLLGMATVDGYFSFRHVREGTWYIQALCKKLQELVPRGEDILSILTEVNEDVSKRADEKGERKQMPQPAYTLRKKLIFPKPVVSLPSFQ
ncbi:caspase-10-like isoform X2 [Tiliqua scincoides]